MYKRHKYYTMYMTNEATLCIGYDRKGICIYTMNMTEKDCNISNTVRKRN